MVDEKIVEWRIAVHGTLADHEFEQDPDDIPGGCAVCWRRMEHIDGEGGF